MKKDITIEQLVDTARALSENDEIFKENLLITYFLSKDYHRRFNEELHYRISGSKEELNYSKIIEVSLFDINFKFLINEE